MRGGVSLAVWIGGEASAELDQVRHPTPPAAPCWTEQTPGTGFRWRLALRQRRRRRPGAWDSAGGLNGVTYAASQVHGFSMGQTRALWVSLEDTDRLTRRTSDRPAGGWPSLMKGDECFFGQLEKALRGLVGSGTPARLPAATP